MHLHNISSNPVIEVIMGCCRLNLFGMQTDVLVTHQRETLQPTMQHFTSFNLSAFNTMHIRNPKSPINTGCHRRNGPNFGRVFLMLNYTDITQNTYIQKLNGYGDNGQRKV